MPAPTVVAPSDPTAFLAALRAADLLSPTQFTRAKTVAGTGSAVDAAGALIAAGLLTRFQADRLLAGRTDGFLLGPYVVLEQVGRGTLSRVYKAKHRTMQRTVAIKVLSADLTDTPGHRESLRAAARAAGKLAHPNVVTAYDANELHDRFHLVLEFVDGADLGALVRARGPLPVTEACEFVRQVAVGLEHAHEKGMVHRDIKPSNLLVARPTPSAPPTVKIADFGLSKGAAGEFAAPELLLDPERAAEVDARADLYSLGRVFHFMLTGRADIAALPVAQLRPDVPPEVAAIVHRLLANAPDDRFASAAELLFHLDAACVPVALPVDGAGAVSFDLPAYPAYPGPDSGYLTGCPARPPDTDTSPWAELTATTVAGDTVPMRLEDTPAPPRRVKPPGHGESVPLWMTATLLVGVVLLCLMGIGVVVRMLAK